MENSRRSPLLVGAHARGRGDPAKLQHILWRWLRITQEGINGAIGRNDPDLVVLWLQAGAKISDVYLQSIPYTQPGCWAPFTEDQGDGDC